jgi:phosphohistidine phosphatase
MRRGSGIITLTPMKTLLVLRHAKSSWHDATLDDHERPLNDRGRRDAPRMGDLLVDEQLVPDLILSSDAARARLTAEGVATTAGMSERVRLDRRLYLAGPAGACAVLREVADEHAQSVVIVGHNPGLEELIAALSGESEDLPTAALAAIVLPIERWRDLDLSTRGTLVRLWRPRELP